MTDRSGQGIEGWLLKIVKTEEEKSFVDTEIQHNEGVLEENQVINGWLKFLLEAFEQEEEVVVNTGEVSHVVRETREDIGSQLCSFFTSILKSGIDYVTVAKRLEYNLLSEGEFADSTQELDIAEGDAYKSIKEVRVATISGT